MPDTNIPVDGVRPPRATETAEQRDARLARERVMLDEARAQFEQGLTMDEAEVEAWLDALDGDEDKPLPTVRRLGMTRGRV